LTGAAPDGASRRFKRGEFQKEERHAEKRVFPFASVRKQGAELVCHEFGVACTTADSFSSQVTEGASWVDVSCSESEGTSAA